MVAKLQKKNDRKNKYINNLPFLSLIYVYFIVNIQLWGNYFLMFGSSSPYPPFLSIALR